MAQNSHVARRHVGVSNVLGLHLRVADKFVRLANAFQSDVRVHCKGVRANGRSILSLLSLAAECGTMLALEAQGLRCRGRRCRSSQPDLGSVS